MSPAKEQQEQGNKPHTHTGQRPTFTNEEILTMDLSAPPMRVSDDEMALNQIPLHARDHCAHLLIELRRCHRKEYYLPWKCEEEKHKYEACLIQDVMRRENIKRREELLQQKINEK